MNFQEVLACLEDAEKRRALIQKLKNAGEHSKPFLNIRDALIKLRMNKAPPGIDETTIMQHTFRFLEVDECFQQLRLVNKPWKHAIETMRFNRVTYVSFGESDVENIPLIYVQKYLRAFRKLNLSLTRVDRIRSNRALILESMTKLNEIRFGFKCTEEIKADDEIFITKMIENSKTTLQSLHLPKLSFANGITFPKLNELSLHISKICNVPNEFENQFPKFLANNAVEVINMDVWENHKSIYEHVEKNYGKHCISGFMINGDMNTLPLKIRTNMWRLQYLENKEHSHLLEYLHLRISDNLEEDLECWERYQEILDQCTNLKAIEITYYDDEDNETNVLEILPSISPERQEIWKARLAYLEKRGVRITKANEIYGNENLQAQVANESGISWRFHFY